MATQELDLFSGEKSVQALSEISTTPLWPLLTGAGATDRKELAKAVEQNPDLRKMARQVNRSLARIAAPCEDVGVRDAIADLIAIFGVPKKVEGEMEAWWRLYFEALSPLPKVALSAAVSELIQTWDKPYIPFPAIILKVAETKAREVRVAAWRCKLLTEVPEPRPEIGAEERARVSAEFQELKRTLGNRTGNPMFSKPLAATPADAADALRRQDA